MSPRSDASAVYAVFVMSIVEPSQNNQPVGALEPRYGMIAATGTKAYDGATSHAPRDEEYAQPL